MRVRRMAAAAVAAVTLAAGTGAAVAATSADDEEEILDRAAERLDVTSEELREALLAARIAEIEQAVAAGELTEEQAQALEERLRESGRVLGGGPGRGHHGHRGPGFVGIGSELAGALGITEQELREAFTEGRTVGEIAEAEGVELDAVREEVRAAVVERLDTAVSEGRLTEAQRDRILERMDAKLGDIGEFGGRPFGRPDGPPRPQADDEEEEEQSGSSGAAFFS